MFGQAERAMVSGNDLQIIPGEASPQSILVFLGAQRRDHGVFGGFLIGLVIFRFRQEKIVGAGLGKYRHAVIARLGNMAHRFLGRDVHHIKRRAGKFGDLDGPVRGLGLGRRWVHPGMVEHLVASFGNRLLDQ